MTRKKALLQSLHVSKFCNYRGNLELRALDRSIDKQNANKDKRSIVTTTGEEMKQTDTATEGNEIQSEEEDDDREDNLLLQYLPLSAVHAVHVYRTFVSFPYCFCPCWLSIRQSIDSMLSVLDCCCNFRNLTHVCFVIMLIVFFYAN